MIQQKDYYLKYKICVSGAAVTEHCASDILERTKEIGKEIVRNNCVLLTGATTGAPYWAAIGAKEAGGISIGISPAKNKQEHISHYRLPADYFDLIIYTGFEYSGRNLLLTRSADAVIFSCGRMGTLNEFTIAFEDRKPIGILTESGGTTELIGEIIRVSHREKEAQVVYDSNPKVLVEKVLELIKNEESSIL
ncbi:MAG: hypothetical protein US76_04470 [Parcubacteria group bacterium GW2011_GWA2_38_13b]|nr:MAG: hypothetical protein US76_04470 [Parcubacteria group bacterium GW2011_GWA2_38_13b]